MFESSEPSSCMVASLQVGVFGDLPSQMVLFGGELCELEITEKRLTQHVNDPVPSPFIAVVSIKKPPKGEKHKCVLCVWRIENHRQPFFSAFLSHPSHFSQQVNEDGDDKALWRWRGLIPKKRERSEEKELEEQWIVHRKHLHTFLWPYYWKVFLFSSFRRPLAYLIKPENFSSSSESRSRQGSFSCSSLLLSMASSSRGDSRVMLGLFGFVVRLSVSHLHVLSVKCHKKFISSHNDDHKMVNREEVCIRVKKKASSVLCVPCFFDLSSFMVSSEAFILSTIKLATTRMCLYSASVCFHCDFDLTRLGSKYEILIRLEEHFCFPPLTLSLVLSLPPATAKQ